MILKDEEDNEGIQLSSWVEYLSKGCENITENLDVSITEPARYRNGTTAGEGESNAECSHSGINLISTEEQRSLVSFWTRVENGTSWTG